MNIRAVSPLVNEANRAIINNSSYSGFKPNNIYMNANFENNIERASISSQDRQRLTSKTQQRFSSVGKERFKGDIHKMSNRSNSSIMDYMQNMNKMQITERNE